ncbi:MAG: universal stress protein [Thermoanaerobaculia bacterium]
MEGIRTILCPVDFTSVSETTVHLAAQLCLQMKAKLVLHHNLGVRPPGYLSVNWMVSEETGEREEKKESEVPERLEKLFAQLPAGLEYEARVTRAPLDMAVIEVAKVLPADLIVMGSHGWSTPAHRSLTEKVILRAPCTVMTTGEKCGGPDTWFTPRAKPADQLKVLLPVDFSSRTPVQVGFAFELMPWMPHRLLLLNVLPDGASEAARQEAEERLTALVPTEFAERTETMVGSGLPAAAIVEAAQPEDVLFVLLAAHRKGPLRRLLFGTATVEVLHDSPCPVWFVPEGWRPSVGEVQAVTN